jgi:hypothetical protein
MKIPVQNFTKMFPVGAALMHADKQTHRHDEDNKRTSPFMWKCLKTPKYVDFNYATMIWYLENVCLIWNLKLWINLSSALKKTGMQWKLI